MKTATYIALTLYSLLVLTSCSVNQTSTITIYDHSPTIPTQTSTKILLRIPTITPTVTQLPSSVLNDLFIASHSGSEINQQKILLRSRSSYFDTEITSSCAYDGSNGILINYSIKDEETVLGEGVGMWGVEADNYPLIDVSQLEMLEFWVKGTIGGETFSILISTNTRGELILDSKNYVKVNSSEWNLVRIPFSDFVKNYATKNLDTIWGVYFVFYSSNGTGSVCIDNIRFSP